MGLVRGPANCHSMQSDLLRKKLVDLGERPDQHASQADLKASLIKTTTTRYLKVWHDHSTVAGHGHFLVLVTALYDAAFYLTDIELKQKQGENIDVQSTVEAQEVHILGRSTSSLDDQAAYNSCRQECMQDLNVTITMQSGEECTDIVRFFHGDGPAQQFESGNTVGGSFCCVACGAKSDRMDDIAYTYRSPKLSIQERQDFLLQGQAWKTIATRPLDKLLLADLQQELRLRNRSIRGKKKLTLESE